MPSVPLKAKNSLVKMVPSRRLRPIATTLSYDAKPWHASEVHQAGEVASEAAGRLLARDHAGDDDPRVARDPDDRREAGGVAVGDADVGVGEPEVPLGELPGR